MGAAHLMDSEGNKAARQLIALVKVVAPRMACDVTDRAIQIYGGEGVCQDTPLAYAYAGARTLRLADGPDEVHLLQAGRIELSLQRMARQRDGDDGTAARRPRRDVHSRL
jgi:alkylation response protein AidB-like acyl-CoA dehydrogenase